MGANYCIKTGDVFNKGVQYSWLNAFSIHWSGLCLSHITITIESRLISIFLRNKYATVFEKPRCFRPSGWKNAPSVDNFNIYCQIAIVFPGPGGIYVHLSPLFFRKLCTYSIYQPIFYIYIISCILIIIDGQDHLFLQNIHQCLSDNMYVHSDLSVFGLYCPIQTVP